tara:strand:- start:234 stop:398 length:165 start_codon:yes stop_codon:yes gene_type:complete
MLPHEQVAVTGRRQAIDGGHQLQRRASGRDKRQRRQVIERAVGVYYERTGRARR